jgi:hypothetical protein
MSDPFNFGSYGASDPSPDNPEQRSSGLPPGGFRIPGFNNSTHGFNDSGVDGHSFGQSVHTRISAADVPAFTGFGEQVGGAMVVGKPPVLWLGLGLTVAAVGVVLAAAFSQILPAVAAWMLAGPIAIGFLAVFVLKDTKSQSAPIYSVRDYVRWLYQALLVVAAIGVCLSAWRIAVWVGHL